MPTADPADATGLASAPLDFAGRPIPPAALSPMAQQLAQVMAPSGPPSLTESDPDHARPDDTADAHRRVEAALDKQLFFIGSCSKSGSTWLQHLLDGHPQVRCHGEAFLANQLRPLLAAVAAKHNKNIKCVKVSNRVQRSGDLAREDLNHLWRTAVGLIFDRWIDGDPNVLAVGDKTPENAAGAAALLETFPQAKLVHLIRDGRDVCVSGWFHNLRVKGDAFKQQFPTLADYIPLMAGQKWAPYIELARDAGRRWPDRFIEVRYEDLHAQGGAVMTALLAFLGVDADAESVASCLSHGQFEQLSGGRGRGEEDRGHFYRKGQIGDWREHFDERAAQAFDRCAGPMLRSLGYADPAAHAAA
ncbi:MAG: sulfotransferase [Planctomycetota bacterium]